MPPSDNSIAVNNNSNVPLQYMSSKNEARTSSHNLNVSFFCVLHFPVFGKCLRYVKVKFYGQFLSYFKYFYF